MRYVSGVLPALGVGGVPVVTYTGWARTTRMRCLPEAPAKYNVEPPDQVSRVKKHPAMLGVLANWVVRQAAEIGADIAALDAGAGAEWERLAKRRSLMSRLSGLSSWTKKTELEPQVRVALEGAIKRWRRRADDCILDWAELMTDPVILAEGLDGTDVTARDIERVVSWVNSQLAKPQAAPVDDEGKPILDAEGQAVGEDEDDPAGRFDDEDDPLLLRLVQLNRGALMPSGGDEIWYEHVAVDEAQDRSALEIKVLVEAVRAPDDDPHKRSVTIAGDTAQRLVFDNNFSGWETLLEEIGQGATVRRSSCRIARPPRSCCSPTRSSAPSSRPPSRSPRARASRSSPRVRRSRRGRRVPVGALRNLMAREPTASCAVIARHPEQADAYFEALKRAEVPALRRIRRDEFNFQAGIDVTDVAQVKGLEFDYVVMVDVNASSYPAVSWARHLLHIGVTRAAHQLWMITTAEPSPLIPSVLRDGGRMS